MMGFSPYVLLYFYGLSVWSILISRGHIDTNPHWKVWVAAFVWPVSTAVVLSVWVKRRVWP